MAEEDPLLMVDGDETQQDQRSMENRPSMMGWKCNKRYIVIGIVSVSFGFRSKVTFVVTRTILLKDYLELISVLLLLCTIIPSVNAIYLAVATVCSEIRSISIESPIVEYISSK
jgi:hypothetical protein